MKLSLLTSLFVICQIVVASRLVERDLISALVSDASSFFEGGEDTSTASTGSTVLKGPPVAATPTSSSKTKTNNGPQSTATATSTASSKSITSTATTFSSLITSSNSTTSTITSFSSTSTSSLNLTTTTSSSPTNITPLPQSSPSNQNSISSAGIAVAVILSLFSLGVIAWIIFRYNPRCRAWWEAREARKFQERSYRDALDGPGAGMNRTRGALGGNGRKSTYLASFFAPRTVKLGDGKEIRRKPVQWGATPADDKVPLANMASPMGRSPVSPISNLEKPLPVPNEAQRRTVIYELP